MHTQINHQANQNAALSRDTRNQCHHKRHPLSHHNPNNCIASHALAFSYSCQHLNINSTYMALQSCIHWNSIQKKP